MTKSEKRSLKRLAAFVVPAIVLAVNKKLGLELGNLEVTGITALALGYLGQSAMKEVAMAKAAKQEPPAAPEAP